MRLDHLKVESCHPIKESLISSKPRAMIGLMVQGLFDGRGCFCHTRFLSERLCLLGWFGHSQRPLLMKNSERVPSDSRDYTANLTDCHQQWQGLKPARNLPIRLG